MTLVDDVREWVGSTPDDVAVQGFLARHGDDPHRAALAILRARRADTIASPASWSIDGDASENAGKADTLKALDGQIARLERLCSAVDTGAATLTSAPILPARRTPR